METDTPYLEEETLAEAPPNDPRENLAYMLEKYCMIRPGSPEERMEASEKFLSSGRDIQPPQVIDQGGEKVPYRLYPTACYSVINSCVKLLEKSLEQEIQGKKLSPEEDRILEGAMCLADQLFSGACTSPDGKFTIHWIRNNPKTGAKEIGLNPHGRRVKQLSTRLAKYHAAKEAMGNKELPPLSGEEALQQEIRISYAAWKGIDPENWDGRRPWELSDSLDAMKENLGFEATTTGIPSGGSGLSYEEEAEVYDQELAQQRWIGLDLPDTLRFTNTQRGNTLSKTPRAWTWNYEEDPLDFVVGYICDNAKPCLEEAHGLLIKAQSDPAYSEAGSQALLLDAKNKNNPDSFWKIIKRLSNHFSSPRGADPEAVLRKLDCARFTLALAQTNRRLGIDPEEFQKIFQEKVYHVMNDPKRRETVTRNELLMETLAETSKAKTEGWGKQDQEIWLEQLQSAGVGAYENSLGMEAERKKLLARLNHLFKTPRELLEKTANNPTEHKATVEKLHQVMQSATNGIYQYLSGRTGQMTRRELRTKVYAMKTAAGKRGNKELEESLSTTGKFLSSISSQIKSGQWYANAEGNKAVIFNFLATMLETPKTGELEFPGSQEPEAKDPLEITIDFLKSHSEEAGMTPMGNHTIKEALEAYAAFEQTDEGGQLSAALRKINKARSRDKSSNKTLSATIADRKITLESAIEIAELAFSSENPIQALSARMSEEIEVLRFPQTLDEKHNERFEKNLAFWKGIHYLSQNIQSRKEPEKYQVSTTGRGTIQNLIAIAKSKLRNTTIETSEGKPLPQFELTRTRERTLAANVTVPISLWLAKEEKGVKNKVSHEEFMESLRTRLNACEVCLQISQSDADIERKTTEFEERARGGKNDINTFVIGECISLLERPSELANGITWVTKHPKEAVLLQSNHPDADTPIKLWEVAMDQKLKKGKTDPKQEVELA